MFRNKYIKITVSVLLFLSALWVATPKVYIHDLLNHGHAFINVDKEAKVETRPADDADFEKYDKPAYFSIFKFICSFIPNRPRQSGKLDMQLLTRTSLSLFNSLLSGSSSSGE
jgi:hypothetical protein